MITASLLVVFSLLTFVYGVKDKPVFSEEIKEIIQTLHNDCVAKTGVAEEDITNCENGIFKEDAKLKCYMFCLLEEASIADEDGVVDYDMLVSLIPEDYNERTSRMIFACKHLDTPDKDKCQRSFEVHKCFYEKDPDSHHRFPIVNPNYQGSQSNIYPDASFEVGSDNNELYKPVWNEPEALSRDLISSLRTHSARMWCTSSMSSQLWQSVDGTLRIRRVPVYGPVALRREPVRVATDSSVTVSRNIDASVGLNSKLFSCIFHVEYK